MCLSMWKCKFLSSRSGLGTVPNNAKIHFNFANYLKDTGRMQEAIQHYQQAVRYEYTVALTLQTNMFSDTSSQPHTLTA